MNRKTNMASRLQFGPHYLCFTFIFPPIVHETIFYAERTAILTALQFMKEDYSSRSHLIVSDSLPALQSIKFSLLDSSHFLILFITSLPNTMSHISIRFLWIPSHAGIIHNSTFSNARKQPKACTLRKLHET